VISVKPTELEIILDLQSNSLNEFVVPPEADGSSSAASSPPCSEPASSPNVRDGGGFLRGRVVAIGGGGVILVDVPARGPNSPLFAWSIVPVEAEDVGREVVMGLEEGDPPRPVILGFVWTPGASKPVRSKPSRRSRKAVKNLIVESEGERLVISSDQELELRCGEASIILTREGKVLIRGTYLSSQSSGVNRVKGGSVHLN
jgi:hypothetical protein